MESSTRKILYIDDEKTNLFIFRELFKEHYNVITSDEPEQALEMVEGVDVVISDMNMPEMSGIEFIKIARSQFPQKQYYILTAYEVNPTLSDALKNGIISKCFQKPMNVEEISKEISSSFKQA